MERVTVRMARSDRSTPWGFGVTEAPDGSVVIVNIIGGSLADRAGLRNGDLIDRLEDLDNLDINAVDRLLVTAHEKIELVVSRNSSGSAATRIWRPEVSETGRQESPYKVNLQHNADTTPPKGFNSSALPFETDSRVKHMQYNSPLGLYSDKTAAEQYVQQTTGFVDNNNSARATATKTDEPAYLRSETLRLLKEQERNQPATTLSNHPNPSGLPVCFICTRPILGVMARAAGRDLHGDCLSCATCGNSLRNVGHHFIEDKFYCDIHGSQRKIGGGRPGMDPNIFVKSSPTSAQPVRNQSPSPRAAYHPQINQSRPLSVSPAPSVGSRQVTTHYHTPKTQGILSPAQRGVPTAAFGADLQKTVYENGAGGGYYDPNRLSPAPSRGYQAPPPPSNPPPTQGRVPDSVRSAVSPRRSGKSPRAWPPPQSTASRYWQIDAADALKKEKPKYGEDLVEMIKENDAKSKKARKSRRTSNISKEQVQQAFQEYRQKPVTQKSQLEDQTSQVQTSYIVRTTSSNPKPNEMSNHQFLSERRAKPEISINQYQVPPEGFQPVQKSEYQPITSYKVSTMPVELEKSYIQVEKEPVKTYIPFQPQSTLQDLGSYIRNYQEGHETRQDQNPAELSQKLSNYEDVKPQAPNFEPSRQTRQDPPGQNLDEYHQRPADPSQAPNVQPSQVQNPSDLQHQLPREPSDMPRNVQPSYQTRQDQPGQNPESYIQRPPDFSQNLPKEFTREYDQSQAPNFQPSYQTRQDQPGPESYIQQPADLPQKLPKDPNFQPRQPENPPDLSQKLPKEFAQVSWPKSYIEKSTPQEPISYIQQPSAPYEDVHRPIELPEEPFKSYIETLPAQKPVHPSKAEADAYFNQQSVRPQYLLAPITTDSSTSPIPTIRLIRQEPKKKVDFSIPWENSAEIIDESDIVSREDDSLSMLKATPAYDGDESELIDNKSDITSMTEEEVDWKNGPIRVVRKENVGDEDGGKETLWRQRAMQLLDDDSQTERDLMIVAALNERLQGLREMEDVDRVRAIECISRHQSELEQTQTQLSTLLESAIVYLQNLQPNEPEEPARPPTPPERRVFPFQKSPDTQSLHDVLDEFRALPPISRTSDHVEDSRNFLATRLGQQMNLEKKAPTNIKSTFERTTNESTRTYDQVQPRAGDFRGGASSVTTATTQQAGQNGGRIPYCEACHQQIRGAFVLATGKSWCPEHFVCANSSCSRRLLECGFVEENGQKFCENCFEQHIAPRCAKCSKPIVSDCLNALQKKWHPTCFTCAHCQKPFGNSAFYLEQGLPYCEQDWNALFTTKCISCRYPIEAGDRWVEALGNAFHSNCFTCARCNHNLEGESFFAKNGQPFCKLHA